MVPQTLVAVGIIHPQDHTSVRIKMKARGTSVVGTLTTTSDEMVPALRHRSRNNRGGRYLPDYRRRQKDDIDPSMWFSTPAADLSKAFDLVVAIGTTSVGEIEAPEQFTLNVGHLMEDPVVTRREQMTCVEFMVSQTGRYGDHAVLIQDERSTMWVAVHGQADSLAQRDEIVRAHSDPAVCVHGASATEVAPQEVDIESHHGVRDIPPDAKIRRIVSI